MYQPYFPFPTNNVGILGRLFRGGFSLSNILNGTNKTLNIINQAIPIIKQVGPTVQNARTMFRVMNEFKKFDTPKKLSSAPVPTNFTRDMPQAQEIMQKEPQNFQIQNGFSGPTFFL